MIDLSNEYPEKGAQLPMAGHKGYGLAVLVEILTAVMTGSAMRSQVQSWASDLPDPSNQGHAFIAMDVSSMMPAARGSARPRSARPPPGKARASTSSRAPRSCSRRPCGSRS